MKHSLHYHAKYFTNFSVAFCFCGGSWKARWTRISHWSPTLSFCLSFRSQNNFFHSHLTNRLMTLTKSFVRFGQDLTTALSDSKRSFNSSDPLFKCFSPLDFSHLLNLNYCEFLCTLAASATIFFWGLCSAGGWDDPNQGASSSSQPTLSISRRHFDRAGNIACLV